jgi:hypothetical protein
MRKRLILLVLLATGPALGRECPLGRATFEPVDDTRHFSLRAEGDGDGYRFTLLAKSTGKIVKFIGGQQGGTGFLHLDEDIADRDGLSTRGVMFRKNLTTIEVWGAGEKPVAYAFFDQLYVGLRDRIRFEGKDETRESTPPDGLLARFGLP